MMLAVKAQSLNHCTTREFLGVVLKRKKKKVLLLTCSTIPNLLEFLEWTTVDD